MGRIAEPPQEPRCSVLWGVLQQLLDLAVSAGWELGLVVLDGYAIRTEVGSLVCAYQVTNGLLTSIIDLGSC
jgi:hypothetical protein